MRILFIFLVCLSSLAREISAQTNQLGRLFIPYLEQASQSNIIVHVCNLAGESTTVATTNALSNTNLFTKKQRSLIEDVFTKYSHITTNNGPSGTVHRGQYRTNYEVSALNQMFAIEGWVTRFQHTNTGAIEDIVFTKGLTALYRTKGNEGYNVSFMRTGSGTMLRFSEVSNGRLNGVFVGIEHLYLQRTNWDFRLADFSDGRLVEYRQHTNGMAFGKYLMWSARDGKLLIEAEFVEPYDWKQYYQMPQADGPKKGG
jgi:hypothetical protein